MRCLSSKVLGSVVFVVSGCRVSVYKADGVMGVAFLASGTGVKLIDLTESDPGVSGGFEVVRFCASFETSRERTVVLIVFTFSFCVKPSLPCDR